MLYGISFRLISPISEYLSPAPRKGTHRDFAGENKALGRSCRTCCSSRRNCPCELDAAMLLFENEYSKGEG